PTNPHFERCDKHAAIVVRELFFLWQQGQRRDDQAKCVGNSREQHRLARGCSATLASLFNGENFARGCSSTRFPADITGGASDVLQLLVFQCPPNAFERQYCQVRIPTARSCLLAPAAMCATWPE